MNLLLIILYINIGLVIFSFIIFNLKKIRLVGSYNGFAFGLLFYYIIIPIILFINKSEVSQKSINSDRIIFNNHMHNHLVALIMVLFSIVIFSFFYYSSYKIGISANSNDIKESQAEVNKLFSFVGYATLIIGGISFILFLSAFGGVYNALRIAELNRSFNVSLSSFIDYRMALLFVPARLITVTPFIFYYLTINSNRLIYKINFILSSVLTITFFVFNAGRAPLFTFFICFLYVKLNKKIKKTWTVIILLGLITLPFLEILDEFFVFLSTGIWVPVEIDYLDNIMQFSSPLRTILSSRDIASKFGFRYGKDFVTSFLNFIPGVNFSKSYESTSQFLVGPNWRVLGGVPNDIITFGYIQLSYPGVMVLMAALGFIFGRLDRYITIIGNKKSKSLITAVMAVYCFLLVASGDFEAFLRNGTILIIISFLLFFTNKKLKKL